MKIQLIRFWCHTCQEFTIQEQGGKCLTCGNITESYKYSDVPKEKLEEQRARYNQARLARYKDFNPWATMLMGYSIMDSSAFENYFSKVIEDDAGQKDIDKAYEKEVQERIRKREALKAEYQKSFKYTQRNDTCPCGSGKKYKKCCLVKFNNL